MANKLQKVVTRFEANKLQKVMTIDNQLNVTSKEYIACLELNYYFAVYEHDQGAVIAVLLRTSKLC